MSDQDATPRQLRYVERGVPRSVSEGDVLVHNHVRHGPNTRVGVNGFRAWRQAVGDDDPPLVECDCGWARLAGAHYRVDLERARRGGSS